MKYITARSTDERGQVTLLLAGVVILAMLASIALAVMGEAMIHRARARAGADSVALAAAVDEPAATEIRGWFADRDIIVEQSGDATIAHSGPSRAAAWAAVETSTPRAAPVIVAIMARAEQLLGTTFDPVAGDGLRVEVRADQAAHLRLVAAELGLCIGDLGRADATVVVFEVC